MTLASIIWLVVFSSACATVAISSWRECRNLSYLAGAFALNSAAFIFLPKEYLVFAIADLVMALTAIVFWCWAARWTSIMSLALLSANLIMYVWYKNPVPYDEFMAAYHAHPNLVMFIEASQLYAMIYFTPSVQRLARRQPKEKKGEPPCHKLTAAL